MTTNTKPATPATPLPWTDPRTIAASWSVWAGDVQVASCRVVDESGKTVPYMVDHDGDAAQNAAYIVEACNAYPRLMAEAKLLREQRAELVAALRHVLANPAPSGRIPVGTGMQQRHREAMQKADALLARLEGAA